MNPEPLDLDGLQDLLWDFARHRVITAAGRVGILRALADKAATPEAVADELGLDCLATGKVVRALTALGVVECEGEDYQVDPALAPLFRSGPEEITAFLEHSHHLYQSWGENLEPWLRGEEWSTTPRSEEELERFGAAMSAMGARLAAAVAETVDLGGVGRVLDVGGGFGHYAAAMCRRSPELRATVLDTPEVARLGRQKIAGTELEGRLDFIGGDYLADTYGEGYDLVLIVNVLHQELAGQAADMVRRAAEALAPGGRVAVVDFAIDDEQREQVLGSLFAINMRSFGDTYPEPVIRAWMEAAGLGAIERLDLGRHRWVIVGRSSGVGD